MQAVKTARRPATKADALKLAWVRNAKAKAWEPVQQILLRHDPDFTKPYATRLGNRIYKWKYCEIECEPTEQA